MYSQYLFPLWKYPIWGVAWKLQLYKVKIFYLPRNILLKILYLLNLKLVVNPLLFIVSIAKRAENKSPAVQSPNILVRRQIRNIVIETSDVCVQEVPGHCTECMWDRAWSWCIGLFFVMTLEMYLSVWRSLCTSWIYCFFTMYLILLWVSLLLLMDYFLSIFCRGHSKSFTFEKIFYYF